MYFLLCTSFNTLFIAFHLQILMIQQCIVHQLASSTWFVESRVHQLEQPSGIRPIINNCSFSLDYLSASLQNVVPSPPNNYTRSNAAILCAVEMLAVETFSMEIFYMISYSGEIKLSAFWTNESGLLNSFQLRIFNRMFVLNWYDDVSDHTFLASWKDDDIQLVNRHLISSPIIKPQFAGYKILL